MLLLALYCVYMSMDPLYFDNPTVTDGVKSFPTSAKVFVSSWPGIEPKTSQAVNARSSNWTTEAPPQEMVQDKFSEERKAAESGKQGRRKRPDYR